MKSLTLLALLFTLNSFAAEILPELSIDECKTTCTSVSHSYQRYSHISICHDIMSCKVLAWDSETATCHFIKNETREFPVSCRSIPPMF